jgi:hypothetical protein
MITSGGPWTLAQVQQAQHVPERVLQHRAHADGAGGSWRPLEEPSDASSEPTDVSIGRGYALYVFRCPASFDHSPATAMQ